MGASYAPYKWFFLYGSVIDNDYHLTVRTQTAIDCHFLNSLFTQCYNMVVLIFIMVMGRPAIRRPFIMCSYGYIYNKGAKIPPVKRWYHKIHAVPVITVHSANINRGKFYPRHEAFSAVAGGILYPCSVAILPPVKKTFSIVRSCDTRFLYGRGCPFVTVW